VIGDVLSNLPMPFALKPTLVILTWKMGQNALKGAKALLYINLACLFPPK
jgi:hypothetical protein